MNPFGTHMSIQPTLATTFDAALANRMPCFQIFLGSPQTYSRRLVASDDIACCCGKGTTIFMHAPYCFSLCNEEVIAKCRRGLVTELSTAHRLGANCGGVVIHPGSSKDTQQGLEKVAETINELYTTTPALGTLLLENSAGQGSTLPTDLMQLQCVFDHLDHDVRSHVGVCIDTCHTFASGVTDWTAPEAFRRQLDETVGLETVRLIHLNDSETPLRSRKDRHATLGAGHIWKVGGGKLQRFVETFKDIPMVTETGDYVNDLKFYTDSV